MAKLRLNKILAQAGLSSRRGAERLVLEGRVAINGVVTRELSTLADPDADVIALDGRVLPARRGQALPAASQARRRRDHRARSAGPLRRHRSAPGRSARARLPGGPPRCGRRGPAAAHQRRGPHASPAASALRAAARLRGRGRGPRDARGPAALAPRRGAGRRSGGAARRGVAREQREAAAACSSPSARDASTRSSATARRSDIGCAGCAASPSARSGSAICPWARAGRWRRAS